MMSIYTSIDLYSRIKYLSVITLISINRYFIKILIAHLTEKNKENKKEIIYQDMCVDVLMLNTCMYNKKRCVQIYESRDKISILKIDN